MNTSDTFMFFPQPLREAIFIRRPQRFLATMNLSDGSEEIVYCANSGAMTGCLVPDSPALLCESLDSKRKRRYTWRAVKIDGVWVGTDTHLANRIVEEALRLKLLPGLETYSTLARERVVESNLKVDFILLGSQGNCLLEVKSANIVKNGVARYPDSLTPRGVRQLKFLASKALEGQKAVLLFLVQRADAHSFVVSNSYDPTYAEAFEYAVTSGVEVMAIKVSVSREGIGKPKILPYANISITSVNTY